MPSSLVKMAEKRYEELFPITNYENFGHTIDLYTEYLSARESHKTSWIVGYIAGWNDRKDSDG